MIHCCTGSRSYLASCLGQQPRQKTLSVVAQADCDVAERPFFVLAESSWGRSHDERNARRGARRASQQRCACLAESAAASRGSLARWRSWTFPIVRACVVVLAKSVVLCVCVGSVARPYLLRARMQCALLVNCHGFRSVLSRATVLEMVREADLMCSLECGLRLK